MKNSYELVLYIDKDGAAQAKKITLGAQSLMATLVQESALRLFQKKIDAEAIMPSGLYPVWPVGDPSVCVSELYQEFGKNQVAKAAERKNRAEHNRRCCAARCAGAALFPIRRLGAILLAVTYRFSRMG